MPAHCRQHPALCTSWSEGQGAEVQLGQPTVPEPWLQLSCGARGLRGHGDRRWAKGRASGRASEGERLGVVGLETTEHANPTTLLPPPTPHLPRFLPACRARTDGVCEARGPGRGPRPATVCPSAGTGSRWRCLAALSLWGSGSARWGGWQVQVTVRAPRGAHSVTQARWPLLEGCLPRPTGQVFAHLGPPPGTGRAPMRSGGPREPGPRSGRPPCAPGRGWLRRAQGREPGGSGAAL